MSGWGIADTASEIEKIKAESADYLRGLNSCCLIDWNTYDKAFDFYMGLIDASYEQGKKDAEQRWIPVTDGLPDDNREVEVTCEIRRFDGKKYRYTCHASYVHRYSIESTDYCNWEDCDEYNEEEDKYYALSGWYERVHNWDDYSYCAIEDFVIAWREQSEPYGGEQDD